MGVLDNTKYMLKVCELYYIKGLSQKEIAAELAISRPQVSRIIASANERKLVKISFNYPNSDEEEYQKKIRDKYGVEAIVFDIDCPVDQPYKIQHDLLAAKCSDYIDIELKDGYRVGVMSSYAIRCIAENLSQRKNRGQTFISLTGGYSITGMNWCSNEVAQLFASRTGGRYNTFNAPYFVSSPTVKDVFMDEPSIRQEMALACTCDISLVGIGVVSPNTLGIFEENMSRMEREDLLSSGALANIGTSFIDGRGRIVHPQLEERLVGSAVQDIEKSKVYAIACGQNKVEAIRATMKGGFIDVLVTSLDTARLLMDERTVG